MMNIGLGGVAIVVIWWVWLAALVAWQQTRWPELVHWLMLSAIPVMIGSLCSLEAELYWKPLLKAWTLLALPVVAVLSIMWRGWLKVSGFVGLRDWLMFKRPDPALRRVKSTPPIKVPSDYDGRLWVPAVPQANPSTIKKLFRWYLMYLAMSLIVAIIALLYEILIH